MQTKILYSCLFSLAVIFQNCNSSTEPVAVNKTAIDTTIQYVCIPCGYDCDSIIEKSPGTCNNCKMLLVDKSKILFGNIQPVDLYKHIQQAGSSHVLLLDVRTAEEFNGTAPDKFGRLKNAVNIPIQELSKRIKELDAYKDKEIIVYCSHSHRSPQAGFVLMQYGFKKVNNLQQGMHRWKQEVTDKESNDSLYIAQ